LEEEVMSPLEGCAARRITERSVSERLQLAHREYARVAADMDAIIAKVRSGVPAADEAWRMERAARAGRLAYENYRQALEEFAHFVQHGSPSGILVVTGIPNDGAKEKNGNQNSPAPRWQQVPAKSGSL
jgi:hypothetical protein